MDRPFLLDVNVLIALFDSGHTHHEKAISWFAQAQSQGWRTCAVTEIGVLRVMTGAGYRTPFPLAEVCESLEYVKRDRNYSFWESGFSMGAWLKDENRSVPSTKMTDVFLLKLAERLGGKLATFDLRITPDLIGSNDPEIVQHIRS